ncbi:MAG TPA: MFS transporter [Phycisphaerae bacterium]|nr:MFS transporter [Phycisphaerae bacterium]
MYEPERIRRDVLASNSDGGGYSFMVGVGETYLAAFAIAVQLGDVAVGLITTVPMLAGALLQLISPLAVVWLGSVSRWVIVSVLAQALSFVPLAIMAALGRAHVWIVFLAIAVYWGSGMCAGAAWVTWMERLIPPRMRAPFFGKRARIMQACQLLGLLAGGFALQAASARDQQVSAFALLFGLAALGRLFSAGCLTLQSSTTLAADEQQRVSFREMAGRILHGADGRLLVYLAALQIGAQMAGPYFAPYMLSRLKFSYAEYATLIAAFYLAKVVASPWLGRLASRLGPRLVLWIGGLGIVPQAAAWMVSTSFSYLLVLHLLGGIAWAAHELASPLMYFELIQERERTSVLTMFNLMNAAAMVAGASLGGIVLHSLGTDRPTYLVLFALSSLTRLAAMPLLARIRSRPGETRVQQSE